MLSKKILIIPDCQVKPKEDLTYVENIGKYILDKKPDIIVCLGDFWDFPSLSSYDKGKLSFEGRRLKEDIEAGKQAMELLLTPLKKYQEQLKKGKRKTYNPRLVFCLGNHENRAERVARDAPEFDGFVGYHLLELEKWGWEVYDFLKPVEVEGIYFCHYLANPFTGKPYAGTAANQLNKVGRSFVVGHKQVLDIAIRPTIDNNMQIGIVAGACYPFDEVYKGHQGNNHFRGLIVLHETSNGYGDLMCVSLDYLKNKYQ